MSTTIVTLQAHPYADRFPMLPQDELDELAASIAANGLRNPIVITEDGMILDGRNRAAACLQIGIEPETVIYEGTDYAEYVLDCNTTRRHMTTGQRAMASALVLADDGRRENGRWAYGRASDAFTELGKSWSQRMTEAGVVLDYARELADEVAAGDMTLNAAFTTADERRRSAEAEELARKAQERAEREAARAKAERDAKLTADLADTKYAALIADGTMTPSAAWAAYQADTEKERRQQAEIERGWRDTTKRIAECVFYTRHGADYAAVYLRDFHPHADKYVAEGMRLTRADVQASIDFLTALKEGLSS